MGYIIIQSCCRNESAALSLPGRDGGPELYVDEGKRTYQALGFKRFSWLSIWPALLSKISRTVISEVGGSV